MKRSMRGRAILAGLVAPLVVLGLTTTSGGAQTPNAADRTFTAAQLAPTERVSGHKAPTSALARTDPELLARDDAEPVNVMIKLDFDSVATYSGGVAGYEATSPLATGEPIDGDPTEVAYEGYVASQEAAFVDALTATVPSADVGTRLRIVYGGFAAVIPANAVEAVLAIEGAVAVQYDSVNQPLTDASPEFVNATPLYGGSPPTAGAGVIYGNLDTGVWPEHPAFAEAVNLPAPPPTPGGTPRACNFGDNPLTPANDPFVCQDKLIGGQPFLATYLSNPARAAAEPFHTARDSNGHGTHTSSTSAGNVLSSAQVLGVERGPIHGMAPGAHVIEYKVCGIQACYGSDTSAAVQQAIKDGVDVINFSISGGTDPFTDPTELAFLDAYGAGVFVSASAGNNGPGAGTVNHLGPWTTTVAASTQTREFATTLTATASNGDVFTMDGASLTAGAGPLPIVLSSAAPYSRPLCDAPAPAGLFDGQLVACQRGVNARVDKGFNVLQGGAEGMILYNPTLADVETDSHWLPAIHLADGMSFVAFMNGHTGVVGLFPGGEKRNGQPDVMAAFSSRGPGGPVIKPDITAPGVQILAGDTPISEASASGPPDEYFQAIAGTSMSSPHVAGAGILLKAAHPDWTPGQIRSALMTTAFTEVVKETLTTPANPFDMGAGRIDVGAATQAPITFDETAMNFAELGGDPLTAIHLNIPSINAPVLPGRIETTRTATNVTGSRQRFAVTVDPPDGTTITATPDRFGLDPGESEDIFITIETDAPEDEQQFGTIYLTERGGTVLHMPVAFVHTLGDVTLTQECAPTTVEVRQPTTCTISANNHSFDEETVDLDTYVSSNMSITAANGATILTRRHAQAHGLTLAGAELGVPSVAPGVSPVGFIPLALFGVTPDPIGDESFIDYNVPGFLFNGVTYTTIGVNSNGYLVAGGGTSEDNNCCNLPDGPDPAPPNNLLAPFWTDLDGTGTPGIYAATLTDGVNTWIVIEHQVNVFGTTSNRHFQVWLGINGTQDISFTYDPTALPGDPAGQDFLVGAENAAGDGDVEAALPTADLVVTSTDPTPGDTASYTLTIGNNGVGTGVVRTEMTSSATLGVTVEETVITITP